MASFITNRSKLNRPSPPEMRKDLFNEPDAFDSLGGATGDFYSPGINVPSSSAAAPYLQPSPPLVPSSSEDPLAGALLASSQMITKLAIVHPCTVIRRQCQVHQNGQSLHVTPLTLVPVVCNMVGQHGISTFWRGSIGAGVLWGLTSVTEVAISDIFGLPRSVVDKGSNTKYWRHILLKASTYFLMTPFYISSFIETIRSGTGLVGGEDNRMMEVIVKGVDRMKYLFFGPRDHSRKFSLIHLAVPTTVFHTSHYIIQTAIYGRLHAMAKEYVNRKPVHERTKLHEYIPQLFATMTSSVLTDLILFPFETVLHRLYVQGTRTLIDNMDTGVVAISMRAKYDGFFHCAKSIVKNEGAWALYAGMGAVVLEYGLQYILHQLVRACFDRGSEALRKATAAHGGLATPPLPSIGTRDPFAPSAPPAALSPITSPRRATQMTSPPLTTRAAAAPIEYPSFGQLSANDPLAQFAASAGKPLQPLFLKTDDYPK